MVMSVIETAKEQRKIKMQKCKSQVWDFVVIGAGITGIQTFRVLSSKGLKVLIIDSGDFSSGTSSNSGMLIWGGLLYLKSLDFKSVFKFSRSRDFLIKNDPENIKALGVTYLYDNKKILTEIAMWFYWFISLFRRKSPKTGIDLNGRGIFKRKYQRSTKFEEALIQTSDSRYSIDLLTSNLQKQSNSQAFNYLALNKGDFVDSIWKLTLFDKINDQLVDIKAANIINCGGVHVDEINNMLGIQKSPYRHLWSKGVYLNLIRKNDHNDMLIFDDPEKDDVLTYCPVGDVSFFGPTEDNIDNNRSNASQITNEEIRELSRKYEVLTGEKMKREDVVSYRLGIRPLCVPSHFSGNEYTLGISRSSKIFHIQDRHFSAVYGGKFTGSYELAIKAAKDFGIDDIPTDKGFTPYWQSADKKIKCIEPEMAVMQEQCWTLKDYLRNRTFIHQSVANGGFGLSFEFKEKLNKLSNMFLQELASEDVSLNAYYQEQLCLNELLKDEIDG